MFRWLLKLLGWTVRQDDDLPPSYVMIVAPHTSNWDFPLGLLAAWSLAGSDSLVVYYDSSRDPSRDARDQIEALLDDHRDALVQARADAVALARYLEFYGGAADKFHGETIPYLSDYTVYTLREPHGVTGHIIPWNYPMQIIGRSWLHSRPATPPS